MSECEIDGIRYPVAVEKDQILFHIADTGESLLETWSDWHLGLGATDHIPGMYYSSSGGDASRFGQIRAPLLFVGGASHSSGIQHAYYFAAKSATNVTYIYKACINAAGTQGAIYKFSADMATLHSTFTPAGFGSTVGRPAFWGSKWYVPILGVGHRLQTVADPPTADTWDVMVWNATALSTFTSGGTAKIARAYSTNQVALATAAPLSSADPGDWASGVSVGDTSTSITDMVENQGLLFVAKEDNLYEFDADSVARPVLPFGIRVGVDLDNGKGMLAFADMILYPSVGGLWRYRVGQSARPVGLATIGTFAEPYTVRHRGLVNLGEWIWMVATEAATSHVLAARLRRPDDPPGHEFVWHEAGPATGKAGKALYVTPDNRLVIQSAEANATQSDLHIVLGADGSPSSYAGTRGSGGQFTLGETNFGRAHKRKQGRSIYVDMDSTGNIVDVRVQLDSGASVSLGTLSASGVVNHTPGTNDKFFRYRINLQITGTGAIIRSITAEARTPSIYRVVVPADDDRLVGMAAEDVRANLMRLVNKGLVTILDPLSLTSWQGYVEKLTETVYQTDKGIGRGIEILISRYTTDGN